MYKICEELQTIKTNYDSNIQIVEGLNYRQKDTIRTIEFYSNNRYLNGQKDELGREKPFYNILNAMCDVENAAKDLDTKDIHVLSDDGEHYTESFLMSKDIYEWMKEVNFAKTLNDMRNTHTRYGSLLVKKCIYKGEDGEELKIEIPEWKNVITDQVDIESGVIVEIHYMLPKELMDMDEWQNKEEAVKQLGKEYGKRITVYEIRGYFPRSWVKELDGAKVKTKDETDFSYQLYYLAGGPIAQDESPKDAKLIPLYWEDDTEEVYKYLARKKKAGRAFGVGVFEEGDEAQVWTNDAVLKQSRAMEYTSKVIGQTASTKLKGRNMMTEVDDGQILEHEDNKPITPLVLLPSGGLAQYNNLIVQWFDQFEKATSGYAAQRGDTPPSGTPFRLQATVLQQSNSVFKDLQEELGIFVTELFEDWVMPYLAKQLNQKHILAHDFNMDELKEIDHNFSTHRANEETKQRVLSGLIVSLEDYATFKQAALEKIQHTKAQRFLEIPKDYYKKFKAKITVNITGEQLNKATVLESLTNIMTVYARNPAIAQDPILMKIFMKIVELSGAGISPVEMMAAIQEQAKQQKEAPANKVSESMSYKDAPPDIQRQMEQQAGMQPSQATPTQTSTQPSAAQPAKELSLAANPA